ncbi:transposable element Tc1 transposase [Trichonephila clavipes]|nr:transposable element Tc1 transposase [Trichonephila clavipes]
MTVRNGFVSVKLTKEFMIVAGFCNNGKLKISKGSPFNLWDHDGRIRVGRYAGERCLPECVIERHNGLTYGIMAWGAISYHGRSNLLRIKGNLNSNRYVREVLQLEVIPFL